MTSRSEASTSGASPTADQATDPRQRHAFAQRLVTDFPFFVHALWTARGLHDKAPLGRFDDDMMRFGAGPHGGYPANSGHPPLSRYRILLAPRGAGKTNFVSCALAAHRLLRDPDHRVVILSKSQTHAVKVMGILREWFCGDNAVPFLRHLAPTDGRDNASQMDVGPATRQVQASITSIGIDGPVEGNRANTVIGDDIETEPNTRTQDAREALRRRCNEFVNLLYATPEGQPDRNEVVIVGTCHHEESLYHKLKDDGLYDLRTWPIVYPDTQEQAAIVGLAPQIAEDLASGAAQPGDPVFPIRLHRQIIHDRRAGGRRDFLMQNMLIARMGDGDLYPLKLRDLIVHPFGDRVPLEIEWGQRTNSGTTALEDPASLGLAGDRLYGPILTSEPTDWARPNGVKAFIDPAGRGPDEFTLAVVAQMAGRLFARAVVGFVTSPDEALLLHVALILRELNVTEVAVEKQSDGTEILRNTLRAHIHRIASTQQPAPRSIERQPGEAHDRPWNCAVTGHQATGRKEARIIDTLEPLLTTHRLTLHPDAVGDTPFTPYNLPRPGGPRFEPAPESGIRPDSRGAFPPGEGLEYTLQHQLTRITREAGALRHDDRVDALAGAVALWTHAARLDPKSFADTQRSQLALKAQREHHDAYVQQRTGKRGKPTRPTFGAKYPRRG